MASEGGTGGGALVHDFMDKEMGKAIPYGVYDMGARTRGG
jgi:hypothetical protein